MVNLKSLPDKEFSKTRVVILWNSDRIAIVQFVFDCYTGKIINADTNGSINIARKVIPDFMKGIEGLPFIPVVLGLWTKIINVDI